MNNKLKRLALNKLLQGDISLKDTKPHPGNSLLILTGPNRFTDEKTGQTYTIKQVDELISHFPETFTVQDREDPSKLVSSLKMEIILGEPTIDLDDTDLNPYIYSTILNGKFVYAFQMASVPARTVETLLQTLTKSKY